MRARLPFVLLLLVCVALGAQPAVGEAGGFARPKITWMVAGDAECKPRVVCFAVRPGESAAVDVTFSPDLDVVAPRVVLQTPNGARVMRVDAPTLPAPPTPLRAGTATTATITIDVPPNFRASQASGRLYLADKGSVLVPPLNIRVTVLHPTPVELEQTPVVIPTNNIRLLRDRFNIRELTVVSGTNLTWTNKDTGQHSVVGTLCASDWSYDRLSQCPFDPSSLAAIAASRCNAPDATGVFPCIDSGPLNPESTFSLHITRPNPRQLLHYYVQDGTGNAPTMVGYVTVK